jgi:hypothetical protein
MKIKISDKGALSVDGKQKFCPYQDEASCGDWCPMFGEPEPYVDIVTVYESGEACGLNEKVNNKLSLCHTELIGDVEDLR